MPIQSTDITEAQAEFIRTCVDSGEYTNASELVRDALSLLQQQMDANRMQIQGIRDSFQSAREAYARGEFVELASEEDFEAAHEDVCRRGRERFMTAMNGPTASA